MKATFKADDLMNILVQLTKGIRGKKAQSLARGLLFFKNEKAEVDFNNAFASCSAKVSEEGTYSVNPIVLKKLMGEFKGESVTIEITDAGVQIGSLRMSHERLNGRTHRPEEALQVWSNYKDHLLDLRLARAELETNTQPSMPDEEEEIRRGRKVSFRLPNGTLEVDATILDYERGASNRRVLVKTRDFQELWISELEIVDFDGHRRLEF